MHLSSRIAFTIAFVITACVSSSIGAQPYPSQPIKIIVPYAAGGGTDITTRIIAQHLSKSLGQSVIVENRSGADTIIGTEFVAKAAPDGYTILTATTALGAFPALYSKLPFDPQRDFVPVTLVATVPFVLAVHPSVPARSVKDFVALAHAKPGMLNYGSGGRSSPVHLATELFKNMTAIDMVPRVYKGGSFQLLALMTGEISMSFANISGGLPHFKAGKLIPLGITSSKRSPVLPSVPTIAESGVPGYEMVEWQGYVVPAGTPADVVEKLHREISKLLILPEFKDRMHSLGMEVVGNTPEQFSRHISSEVKRWKDLAEKGGIKTE